MKLVLLRSFAAAVFVMLCASAAQAAPLTINFRYADPNSTAQAVGSITFESTLLPNPGVLYVSLPNAAVLALNVTVSGSATGNGSFSLADFTGISFNTGGGTLNFSQQLVGQPTSGSPWGTPDSNGGDFNLFSGSGGPRPALSYPPHKPTSNVAVGLPPNGVFFFTLGADQGNGEDMVLTSAVVAATAAAAPTPTLSPWSLLALAVGLLGFGAWFGLRRYAAR